MKDFIKNNPFATVIITVTICETAVRITKAIIKAKDKKKKEQVKEG